MVEIKNLNKKFKNIEVLKQLDFSIPRGELIYIFGINGCGKSTLFKLICDILTPDSGSINIEDDVVIGALIENPGFLETESMKKNLKFLGNLNKNYDEEKIKQLCTLFELDFNNKNAIKSYSVGMRQKVGIIQAVMENQNLILLDEPTRGLDKKSIVLFIELVKQLNEEGKTIVIASHDQLAEIPFSYIYELDDGQMFKK